MIIALVPTGFAIHYNNQYNELSNSEQVEDSSGLMSTIESLRASVKELTAERDSLSASLQKITAENDANKALVADLKAQVETLIAEAEDDEANRTKIDELNAEIVTLEATIAQDEETIATLTTERDNYILEIAELEKELLEANNEITRLNGLMADYEDIKNQASQVIFYVGDTNVQTDAIKPNETVQSIPSVDGLEIVSWTLSDGTVVDPSTYAITEDTNFYANYYEKVCDVKIYNYYDGVVNSETVSGYSDTIVSRNIDCDLTKENIRISGTGYINNPNFSGNGTFSVNVSDGLTFDLAVKSYTFEISLELVEDYGQVYLLSEEDETFCLFDYTISRYIESSKI